MRTLGRATILSGALSLAWASLSLPAAHAQLSGPSSGAPTPDAERALRAAAGPRAHLERGSDGRLRAAWAMAVALPAATPEDKADAFFARYGEAFAVSPGATPRALRVVRAHGMTIVHLARPAFGGVVHGSDGVLRLDRHGRVDYVALTGFDLPLAGTPETTAERALARALELSPFAPAEPPEARLGGLRLGEEVIAAFIVDVDGTLPTERERFIFDARDGRLLGHHSRLAHQRAWVYAQDPVTDDGELTDVELSHLESETRLDGTHFRSMSCNAGSSGCEPTQFAEADALGDFYFEPDERSYEDPFSEVHAYYHADTLAEYFREVHDFTYRCPEGTQMPILVNYTEAPRRPYPNAAYSPGTRNRCGTMLFGQASIDFAYDADVVYHEFGHGVVDQTAGLFFFTTDNLGVSYEPGALNEGTADYFAATFAGDPAIGEYLGGLPGLTGEGSLRRIDGGLRCPHDLVGESHFDGRIWAGLGWTIREALGPEKADALFFTTLASLSATSDLATGAMALIATAEALAAEETLEAGDLAIVEEALDASGLPGCVRIVPLDDGEPRTTYSGQEALTGLAGGGVLPVHYRVDVPPDATAVSFRLVPLTPTESRYRVFSRVGSPIRIAPTRNPPFLSGEVHQPDTLRRVRFELGGEPSLTPCDTLYLAVQIENLQQAGQSLLQVDAEIERSGLDTPCPSAPDAGPAPADGGVPDDGGDTLEPAGGGCGCRAAPRSHSGLWLVSLAALALTRRRRVAIRAAKP